MIERGKGNVWKKRLTIQLVMGNPARNERDCSSFLRFWIAPKGKIHNSVLVAFGETCTFARELCLGWIIRIKLNRYKMKERISRNLPGKK